MAAVENKFLVELLLWLLVAVQHIILLCILVLSCPTWLCSAEVEVNFAGAVVTTAADVTTTLFTFVFPWLLSFCLPVWFHLLVQSGQFAFGSDLSFLSVSSVSDLSFLSASKTFQNFLIGICRQTWKIWSADQSILKSGQSSF